MALVSSRTRIRVWEISLTGAIICFAWLLQLTVLSGIELKEVICSLPLTMTIVWGAVFGSALPALTPEELRSATLSEVMMRQAIAGSTSACLVGATFGALYASIIPVYPVCYPLIGWIAGYFCLKDFSQAPLLCIPLVFGGTIFAETIMACQLALTQRPDVFQNLIQVALPEAAVNSIIAPLVLFPLRSWWEFSKHYLVTAEE